MSELLEPKEGSFSTLCPVGFVVHEKGMVDTFRGCGHRRCYPSACEIVKRLKDDESND